MATEVNVIVNYKLKRIRSERNAAYFERCYRFSRFLDRAQIREDLHTKQECKPQDN